MPSSGGLMQLSNGSNSNGVVIGGGSNNNNNRMDGTLSQSMDSVNTVAAEEEVNIFFFYFSIVIQLFSTQRTPTLPRVTVHWFS